MKLLSSYFKEMKIAARGFYFYIEIGVAAIILIILLVSVAEDPPGKVKEFLFYDMPEQAFEYLIEKSLSEGRSRPADATEFKLKPAEFTLTSLETGEVTDYSFDDEKTLSLTTFTGLDPDTGKVMKTVYITETEEDMLRLSYAEREVGAVLAMDEKGNFSYRYPILGYETERYSNLLYILHNESPETIEAQVDKQVIRTLGSTETLNNRENIIPAVITFMGSLMGFFIVIAYIFLDKDEGVIKAFVVTPSSVWKYLLTKTFVIITTVVISTSIITIPIMGVGPDYLLLYVFLIITSFGFSCMGLLLSSFFNSISGAFGALYVLMIALMLPAFSYYIPSFDPYWLRFFPTYPVLQAYKELLIGNGDVIYVLTASLGFLAGGILLLILSTIRFKKSLTV